MAADLGALPLIPSLNRLTDINYSYSFGSSDIIISEAEAVIIGDVYNVLTTFIGDEPGNPTYGSNLQKYVFSLFTEAVEQLCLLDVFNAFKANIPQFQMSLPNSHVFVSSANRIIGISVGVIINGRVIPVEINFS